MDIDRRIAEILARSTASNDNFKDTSLAEAVAKKENISAAISIIGNHNVVINFGLWFLPVLFILFYTLLARLIY